MQQGNNHRHMKTRKHAIIFYITADRMCERERGGGGGQREEETEGCVGAVNLACAECVYKYPGTLDRVMQLDTNYSYGCLCACVSMCVCWTV